MARIPLGASPLPPLGTRLQRARPAEKGHQPRRRLDNGRSRLYVWTGSGAFVEEEITLLLWTYGAARIPASVSGVMTAAIPALGYGFAVAAGEPATWLRTAGAAFAIAGVLLAARSAGGRTPRLTAHATRRLTI